MARLACSCLLVEYTWYFITVVDLITAGLDKIILQWISAHCGIKGKKRADMLAKKGSKIMQKEKQKL